MVNAITVQKNSTLMILMNFRIRHFPEEYLKKTYQKCGTKESLSSFIRYLLLYILFVFPIRIIIFAVSSISLFHVYYLDS